MSASRLAGLDLCKLPGGSPPSGTVVNFENPRTLVPVLISVCVIMTVGAILFTSCRLYVNRLKLRWSDCFVTIALILSIAQTGILLSQAKFARHQWDTRACWFNDKYAKTLFSQSIITTFVLFFSKASIFLLFHQIFEVKRPMRLAVRFGVIFSGVLYLTGVPVTAVMSAPHRGETWTSALISTRSRKELIWGVVVSAVGTLLDIYIFILPLPIILRLQMTTKRKLQTLAIFATALMGVIASILSLVYRTEMIGTNDNTWKLTALMICVIVENDVAIIVSSTHGFSKFIKTYVPELRIVKSFRSTLGGSRSGNSNKASWHRKENPNRPRTGRGSGKKINHGFDGLSDTFILKSASSAEMGAGIYGVSQAPVPPGILRTVDVTQETHYPDSTPATRIQEPQTRNNPAGVFYYGPGAVQPPTQPTWSHYIPTSTQPAGVPYLVPDYESEAYASGNRPSQKSTDELVVQRPGEP